MADEQHKDLPTSRKAAKEQGAKYYFTGVPCCRGHISKILLTRGCYACGREDSSAFQKKRYAEDKHEWRKYTRRWKEKNPERVCKLRRGAHERMLAKDPERVRDKWRRSATKRRLRQSGCESNYTRDDISEIRKLQRNRCAYCKTSLKNGYHIDHIVPLAKQGSNDRRNIQLTCPSCNRHKSDFDPVYFAQRRGMLI